MSYQSRFLIPMVGCLACLFFFTRSYAQSGVRYPTKRPHDWWQADWKKDSIPGISLNEAYDYLKGRKSQTVIVAIIDNCVDTAHEKLKDYIWTNKKEIAGNNKDDDGNGYIDDVHGWCFIANKNNAIQTRQSALEVLVYEAWKKQFENIDPKKLTSKTRPQYDIYQTAKKMMFEKLRLLAASNMLRSDSVKFVKYVDNLMPVYQEKRISEIQFLSLPYSTAYDSCANALFAAFSKSSLAKIALKDYDAMLKTNPTIFSFTINTLVSKYKYDTLANYRAIIGDDPDNLNDKTYGTPTINLRAIGGKHATMIAGIICANRNTSTGMKGIADNVLIMPLVTAVPDGGSISKDITLAIHYAVDNGASIINMSFNAKPWLDEHEKELREAFDYAYKHNVLIVNAAGNDGAGLDNEKYLLGQGSDGKDHNNYIRVGATTSFLNNGLVADFSQFGEKSVDLFAPGSNIYSTTPGNKYETNSGTSFSCPVVVGVAALLKSYFPTLTAKQLKEILLRSAYKPDLMVTPPISSEIKTKMPFSKMSKSGGIVNAYNAVKMADEIINK
jgi:cell wall-associated protease